MSNFNYTILVLVTGLILGILSASHINLPTSYLVGLLALCFSLLFITHLLLKRNAKKQLIFTLLALLSFVVLGILNVKLKHYSQQEYHYKNRIQNDDPAQYTFSIQEILKPNAYNNRYVIEVHQHNTELINGKVLLNITKDSILPNPTLAVDAVYTSVFSLQQVPKPKNPFQFDYGKYLSNQRIYAQAYVSKPYLYLVDSHVHTLKGNAHRAREYIKGKLSKYKFSKNEWAVINALLLGQRQELSTALRDQYVDAGLIHILAVSGLHVGIFMLILQFLLRPLGNYKWAIILRTIIIIFSIWSFAFIAGLSPSILRAATMFSFIQLGNLFNRNNSGLNALVFSAFLLLLIDPNMIYEVGFQLSYLAVFFIIWLQPPFYALWQPSNWILRKVWEIASVTVVAQLGVLPLSLYYFHQFPGLFLLANIPVLFFLAIILGFGILIIILAVINLLPDWLAQIFNQVIAGLNNYIAWIAGFDQFIIKHIFISNPVLIALFITTLTLGLLLRKPNYTRTISLLSALLLFCACLFYQKYSTPKEDFYVLHKTRSTVLVQHFDNTLHFFSTGNSLDTQDYLVMNFLDATPIKNNDIILDSTYNYFRFKRNHILVIDSLGVYKIPEFNADYIVLSQSPKLNLDRLLDIHKPKVVIADGSNYKSYVARWKITCLKRKIPFHSTYEKGFYKIE